MKYPKLRILLTALLILAMAVGVIHSVWAGPAPEASVSEAAESRSPGRR